MSTKSQSAGVADEETSVTDMADASDRLETDALAESDSKLELDQVFEILKNQRRRYVLQYLNEIDDTVSMSDLA
jgi:predicted Zn-ribbon and HTH transcriptional regulator